MAQGQGNNLTEEDRVKGGENSHKNDSSGEKGGLAQGNQGGQNQTGSQDQSTDDQSGTMSENK